jgi:transposase InsO family protein
MYIPYTTNPHIPRVRMQSAQLVLRDGWSTRKVARYTGFNQSTIVRWVEQAQKTNGLVLPTRSSRPHTHPDALPHTIVRHILELRSERDQCAEILHHRLGEEGIKVGLSSVKRVLKRHGISRFSKWKKWHQYPLRPQAEKPGMLVQIDSMREGLPAEHLYAYAAIDVCSRWAHAVPVFRINTHASNNFVIDAQTHAPFSFHTIQSDHGSEFSKWFTKALDVRGVEHHHSRVRTPTDNAYVERFIQTLQRECLNRIPRNLKAWQKEIPEFIRYYNHERPHMALNYQTPAQVMRSY